MNKNTKFSKPITAKKEKGKSIPSKIPEINKNKKVKEKKVEENKEKNKKIEDKKEKEKKEEEKKEEEKK